MNKPSEIVIQRGDWQLNPSPMQSIRHIVFVEEQQVPVKLEWDEEDARALHFIAYLNNQAVGTARLLNTGHIGRMAVLQSHRQQGVGRQLLTACEQAALDSKLLKTQLHAQEHAIVFYEKQGYTTTGNSFMDAGIPHRSMYKKLNVTTP